MTFHYFSSSELTLYLTFSYSLRELFYFLISEVQSKYKMCASSISILLWNRKSDLKHHIFFVFFLLAISKFKLKRRILLLIKLLLLHNFKDNFFFSYFRNWIPLFFAHFNHYLFVCLYFFNFFDRN